jgi:uncharacterized protein (TIGR03435 family)
MNRPLFALALTIALVRGQERSLRFEVASVKKSLVQPTRGWSGTKISGPNVTSRMSAAGLINFAYGVKHYQVIITSKWAHEEVYDITAKAEGEGVVSEHDAQLMMQSLLAERFQLKFHQEPRELPCYALVVAKGGPKFKEASPDDEEGMRMTSRNHVTVITAKRASLDLLVDELTVNGDRPVIDKTGLTGEYAYTLSWTIDRGRPPLETDGPSIFVALQEQLGLKLEPQKAPVMTIIVDRLEKPVE